MATLASLVIKIQGDIASLEAAVSKGNSLLESVNKNAEMLKKGMEAAFAFEAVEKAIHILEGPIKKTEELAESTRKLQRETGLTAEASSGMIAVFEHVGLAAEVAEKGLGIFNKNLLNASFAAQQGKDAMSPFTSALTALDVKFLDASNHARDGNTVFLEVADRFARLQDTGQKAALAMDIFGKSGKDLLPVLNLGSDGIKELEAKAKSLGVVLTQENVNSVHEFVVSQREMNEMLGGLQLVIGTAVMPELTKYGNWFVGHQAEIRAFFEDGVGYVKTFADAFDKGFNVVIIPAFVWVIDHETVIVGVIVAIGVAFAWTNPVAAAFIGASGLIALVGLFSGSLDTASDSTLRLRMHIINMAQDGVAAVGSLLKVMALAATGPALNFKIFGIGGNLNPAETASSRSIEALVKAAQEGIGKIGNQSQTANEIAARTANPEAHALMSIFDDLSGTIEKAGKSATGAGSDFGVLNDQVAKGAGASKEAAHESAYLTDILKALKDGHVSLSDLLQLEADAIKEKLSPAARELVMQRALEGEGVAATSAAIDRAMTDSNTQMVARLDLEKLTRDNLIEHQSAIFDFNTKMAEMKDAVAQGGDAVSLFSKQLTQTALDLTSQSLSSVLGAPTKELATLEAQLASVNLQIANGTVGREGPNAQSAALVAALNQQITALQAQGKLISDPVIKAGIDGEIAARQAQVKSLQDSTANALAPLEKLRTEIQNRIGIEQAQTAVLKAQQTLNQAVYLTDVDRNRIAGDLLEKQRIQAGLLQAVNDKLGVLPFNLDAVNRAAQTLSSAMGIANNSGYSANTDGYHFASLHGMPSYDVGTPYVPSNQIALLHRGEAVIPASQNSGAGGGQPVTVVVELDGQVLFQAMQRHQGQAIRVAGRGV